MTEDKILYPRETEGEQGEELCVRDLETDEITTYPCASYEGVVPVPEKEAFLVVEEEGCYLVGADGKTADRLQWEQLEEGLYAQTGFEAEQTVTKDGRMLIALELRSKSGEKRIAVLSYSADAKEAPEVSLYPIDYEYIGSLCLEEGSYQHGANLLYVTSNHTEETDSAAATAGMSGRLQTFDLSGQNELWRYDLSGGWLYDVCFAHKEGSSYLLCQKYGDALLLDRRDGTWYYLDTEYREAMSGVTFSDCTSSNVMEFAMGDGYCVTLPYNSNRITVYQRALGQGMEVFHEGEDIYSQAQLSGDGKLLAAARLDDEFFTCVEMFDTTEKERIWTYEDAAFLETMLFGDFDGDGTELLLVVTDDAYHIIDPADGTIRRTVTYENEGAEYLGIDRENGVLLMKGHHTLYGYRLADGKRLYEEALADGLTAVCNGRPFYAVASTEKDSLLFYQMGEEDVYMTIPPYDVDVEYLETMFFSAEDDELYLVYRDGTVRIFFVDWDETMLEYFCGSLGKYMGFPGKMNRYEPAAGADFYFLCGDNDAYQITLQNRRGQWYSKYARIHGYLAYDAGANTLYLHNGDTIYTSPLYSMEETVGMAEKVLQHSSYWNYGERWPYCLRDDQY